MKRKYGNGGDVRNQRLFFLKLALLNTTLVQTIHVVTADLDEET